MRECSGVHTDQTKVVNLECTSANALMSQRRTADCEHADMSTRVGVLFGYFFLMVFLVFFYGFPFGRRTSQSVG